MNLTKIVNLCIRAQIKSLGYSSTRFGLDSQLQNKRVYKYVQCKKQGIEFLQKYATLVKQQPEVAVELLINSYPQLNISVLRQLPQLTTLDKQLCSKIVFQILRRHIAKNYFGIYVPTKCHQILLILKNKTEQFVDFIQKDPENQDFYILCLANFMTFNYADYIKEKPQLKPSNDLLIYLAKLRQKQVAPQTKVHLCRIIHMLKLDYQDYQQFVKNLQMDIKTQAGMSAFEGIIWLYNYHGLISQQQAQRWINQAIQKFDQLSEQQINRVTDRLFNLLRQSVCLDQIRTIAILMAKAILKQKKSLQFKIRAIGLASIVKCGFHEIQQDALQNIEDYKNMISDNQSKKLITNVYKYNSNKIPEQIMRQCIKNSQFKIDNFINHGSNKSNRRDILVIYRELYFINKMISELEIKEIDQFSEKILKVGCKIVKQHNFESAILCMKILESLGCIQKALKIIQAIDATVTAEFADIWLAIFQFLVRNGVNDYYPRYSIFELNFKDFFELRFNHYSQIFFFHDLTNFLLRVRDSPARKKIDQIYKQKLEQYILSYINQGNYPGGYLAKFAQLIVFYNHKNPKIPRLIQENLVLLIFDSRPLKPINVIDILECYKKLPTQNPRFIAMCEKILTEFDKRKTHAKYFLNTSNNKIKLRESIQNFAFRNRNRGFSLKQTDQFED